MERRSRAASHLLCPRAFRIAAEPVADQGVPSSILGFELQLVEDTRCVAEEPDHDTSRRNVIDHSPVVLEEIDRFEPVVSGNDLNDVFGMVHIFPG